MSVSGRTAKPPLLVHELQRIGRFASDIRGLRDAGYLFGEIRRVSLDRIIEAGCGQKLREKRLSGDAVGFADGIAPARRLLDDDGAQRFAVSASPLAGRAGAIDDGRSSV